MRWSGFFLPGLSMGLLYCSLNMMMTVVNLRGSSKVGKSDPMVLLHFGLVMLVALVIYLLVRKGMRRLRPLAAVLAAVGLFCISIPALPAEIIAAFGSSRPPVFSLCMSLFLPVSFYLFFRTAPDGKEGFAFALVIAANEFLWSLIFPFFNLLTSQDPAVLGRHLFSLCCWLIGGGGLCLAIAVARITHIPNSAPLALPYPASIPLLREKCAALGLIAVTRITVSGVLALSLGMFLPKTAMTSEALGIPYILFIFMLPIIGWILESHPGKIILFFIPGLLAAFGMSLAYAHGLIGQMTLFYPLSIAQQTTLLLMLTATSKMLKNHAVFPLVIVLGYCLHTAQFGGLRLGALVQDLPHGVPLTSLALVALTTLCLWRLRLLLIKKPELWPLPGQEGIIAPEPSAAKLSVPEAATPERPAAMPDYAAFDRKFGLSEQESLVAQMLAQGRTTEAIATELQVAESTVRTYVSRLLRKTGTENRTMLLRLITP